MNLLWSFKFELAKDPVTGQDIPIDVNKVEEGLLLLPPEFKCSIRPRSQAHSDIIRSEFAKARNVFEQFEHEIEELEKVNMK